MATPEWLRPVSERFLGGDPGPPPWTVRVAAVLCAGCTVIAAGMVAIWGPMVVRMIEDPVGRVPWFTMFLAGLAALAGAALCAVFAPATVLLARRGWFRLPVTGGLVLGGLAAFGLCAAAAPAQMMMTGQEPVADWSTARFVAPRLLAALVAGFGLVLLLRTGSASSWLARRRYQVRGPGAAGSERQGAAEQTGGG